MKYVLTTNALSKSYGRFQALDELSMHVPKGAIYGFVGKNGAGKTTCNILQVEDTYCMTEKTQKRILESRAEEWGLWWKAHQFMGT